MSEIKAFLSKNQEGRICATLQCGSIIIQEPLPDSLAGAKEVTLQEHFAELIPKMIDELNAKREKNFRKEEVREREKLCSQQDSGDLRQESPEHASRSYLRPAK